MLSCQKHLFSLSENIIYLNGAYMSPQLKSVEEIGIEQLRLKAQPHRITVTDFFHDKEVLRKRFAQLIHARDPKRVAIIPSVSFGMATVMKNISFSKGDEIVVLEEQFPSNFYTWKALEKEQGIQLRTIMAPTLNAGRAKTWNERILEAINSKTKCVAIPYIHWADGTCFDLVAIRQRTNDVGAYLIIDGTQSIGAMPFSVDEIKPDALICAGYKWLMAAYGLGVAYFGERFDEGTPLDNNWMNHEGAENFSKLVHYNEKLQEKAMRYDVGESSNFILVPMLGEGIRQVVDWNPSNFQAYCRKLGEGLMEQLTHRGYFIEQDAQRAHHLFGIYLPENSSLDTIKQRLLDQHIHVSYRGNAIRVSPSVYNTRQELEKLVSCFN
ncbi:MAG: aminotransferase class V-fold PLP-dependent enzyme [Flavobacteriaceae bacterium]|nr:aminotransferase class V-fold PLP-dependent enzyme [Flavobacteriaceae bacterium]